MIIQRIQLMAARMALWLFFASVGTLPPALIHAAEPPIDFSDTPIYEIGEIPFLTVWEGRETKFRVRATSLGAGTPVQAGFLNRPSGTIFFEAGNFFYRPGADDKAEFTVTFSASSGPNRLEQIVTILPIPLLPPENELLGVERKGVPDPASRDYLVVSDLKETVATLFNHAERRLRTVTISGKEVILREGHANRLFESYNGNEDIREFRVNAEKLIVASAFRLPSAKIVIHARHLEFQDLEGEISYLSTEPKAFPKTPEAEIPGENGLPGGDIDIFVENAILGTTETKRFILRGGRGQDGAPGADGEAGRNAPLVPSSRLVNSSADAKATCTALVQYKNDGGIIDGPDWYLYIGPNKIKGDDAGDWDSDSEAIDEARKRTSWKPTSGTDAIPAGLPGNGGTGGRVRSNNSLIVSHCVLEGGAPGASKAYQGGAAGTPTTARFYQTEDNHAGAYKVTKILNTIHTAKGKDAPAPIANEGQAGTSSLDAKIPWISGKALRQVLNHVKDAYLDGELEFTERTVTENLTLLEQSRLLPSWDLLTEDEHRDINLIEEDFSLLSHRLASGLDYFNYPQGWVPLLSLEANKLLFEQEVDRAIGILYLEYWLSDTGRSLQSKLGALADARVKLAAESESQAKDFEAASNLLPQLETEVQGIEQETIRLQNELKAVEELLMKRAEANLKGNIWKRVARGLAIVAKMIPVPEVQALGTGLDLALSYDPKAPWETIEGITDVVSAYKAGDYAKNAKTLNDSYKKIKFPDLPGSIDQTEIKGFIDDVQKQSKPIIAKLKVVRDAFAESQAPKSQIEAEIARLKAESKEFKDLGSQISELIGKKEVFMQQVAQTIQLLGGLSEGITGNLLAMDSLNEDFAQSAGALDDRALMYLKEIGRRARERLLLYHYYVKKAYEYRLLKPYPGRLDLQKLFDQFLAIAEASGDQYRPLTREEFQNLRGVYDNALGELIKEVVVEYSQNAPAISAPRRVALSSEELSRLNEGEAVLLDLRNLDGLFRISEESLRIISIKVLRMEIEPVTDPQPFEEVSLFIEHSGSSTLRTTAGSRLRAYRFRHYTQDTEVPVQWGARFFPNGGDLFDISRSLSADSLLGSLLQRSGTSPHESGYFTYLGALAKLRLRKEQTALGGRRLALKDVVLQIQYEYVPRRAPVRTLELRTEDGLAQYVKVSNIDIGGRQDGIGSFSRTYEAGSTVTLSVPDRVGNLRFAGFSMIENGQLQAFADNPTITLRSSAVSAKQLVESEFDGSEHHLEVKMDADLKIEAKYEPVEGLQLGISLQAPNGNLILHLDGERMTPYSLETAPTVKGPWLPLERGVMAIPPEVRLLPLSNEKFQFYRLTPK